MSYEIQEILNRIQHLRKYTEQLENRIENLEIQMETLNTPEQPTKTETLCNYCKSSGKDCTPENCLLPTQEKNTTMNQELEYLIEQQTPPTIDHIEQARIDKDGTYYCIIMFHLPKGIMCNCNCITSPAWLIYNDINGQTYAFQENSYLAEDYLQEKLGKGRITLSKRDIQNIKIVIESIREKYRRTH